MRRLNACIQTNSIQSARMLRILVLAAISLGALIAGQWQRHTIDASSQGADGVRLADVNGDGLQDIATGWEEGGKVRAYLNPGHKKAREPWPAVTGGSVPSPEDAVFVDLNRDGAVDVVSSTEGKSRTLFVHWAPSENYLDPSGWRTEPLPSSAGMTPWMYVLPLDNERTGKTDLVAGSKNDAGAVGIWKSNANDDKLSWQHWYDAGWIMSLIARDVDGDGDDDVLATDRKGEMRGALWFENTGREGPWPNHRIGPVDNHQIMFLHYADLDGDGLEDAVAAVREGPILFIRRLPGKGVRWETHEIDLPPGYGTGKAVAVGDINLDGTPDLVFTCENAHEELSGVGLLTATGDAAGKPWQATNVGGPEGVKFDLVELLDLDGDGDLDILTCEERDLLGVVWYENPTR